MLEFGDSSWAVLTNPAAYCNLGGFAGLESSASKQDPDCQCSAAVCLSTCPHGGEGAAASRVLPQDLEENLLHLLEGNLLQFGS